LNPERIFGDKENMCEANAYLIEGQETTLVMESVDTIEPQEDGIQLVSIFGEQKFLKAQIHSLSLVDNKVYLKHSA
jgi:predicted RNA-binding protein